MTDAMIIDATATEAPSPPRASQVPARRAAAAPPSDPMGMIGLAIQRGADISVVTQLVALQERVDANNARKAFDAAIADARANIPVIIKNRRVMFESDRADVKNGKVNYAHEDLAGIAEQIDPVLSKHGLSYRFTSEQPQAGALSITCIVSHRDGHSERTTLATSVDLSGKKNHIQGIGSAATYLQRYTLKLALGLAAAEDDDGRASGDPVEETKSAPRASGAPRASQQKSAPPSQTDVTKPHKLGVAFRGETWSQWGERYIAAFKTANTVEEAQAWDRANDVLLEQMNAKNRAAYDVVFDAFDKHLNMLAAKAAPAKQYDPANITTGKQPQVVVWEKETAPSPDTEYDAYLKWVEDKLVNWSAENGNPGDLEEFWTACVEKVTGIFPSDKDDLMSLYRKAEHRIGG